MIIIRTPWKFQRRHGINIISNEWKSLVHTPSVKFEMENHTRNLIDTAAERNTRGATIK